MAAHLEDDKNGVETIDNLANIDPNMNDKGGVPVFIENTDEEKRLVRKIDLYLMPTIWVLYCFSYMVCISRSLKRLICREA
jgi:hypothetical protein